VSGPFLCSLTVEDYTRPDRLSRRKGPVESVFDRRVTPTLPAEMGRTGATPGKFLAGLEEPSSGLAALRKETSGSLFDGQARVRSPTRG
jgi:hypothetical protein